MFLHLLWSWWALVPAAGVFCFFPVPWLLVDMDLLGTRLFFFYWLKTNVWITN